MCFFHGRPWKGRQRCRDQRKGPRSQLPDTGSERESPSKGGVAALPAPPVTGNRAGVEATAQLTSPPF